MGVTPTGNPGLTPPWNPGLAPPGYMMSPPFGGSNRNWLGRHADGEPGAGAALEPGADATGLYDVAPVRGLEEKLAWVSR